MVYNRHDKNIKKQLVLFAEANKCEIIWMDDSKKNAIQEEKELKKELKMKREQEKRERKEKEKLRREQEKREKKDKKMKEKEKLKK